MDATIHTQGPWTVCRGDWSEDGNARYELEGIRTIGAADAYLIAAAPDLYAALEEIINTPWIGGKGGFVKARAALAKARGES